MARSISDSYEKFTSEGNIMLAKFKRQFVRPPFPQLKSGLVNLHLGCGSVNHPKFINIDGLPDSHIHYVRAINNLSIFKNESVDLIYACHCLEHFSHREVPNVLTEWFRVLKSGGVCRISVPNFDLLLKVYQDNNCDVEKILLPLMGGQEYKYNFHLTLFTQRSLEKLLLDTGFKHVQKWIPGTSELTTFADYSDFKLEVNGKEFPINLNIEAYK